MALDTKEVIAQAAVRLLIDRKKKKLTVKDLVEECHITRQTFYYHFEDIPHLLGYIAERGGEQLKEELRIRNNLRDALWYFFSLAVNLKPDLERVQDSNYADEVNNLLRQQFMLSLEQIAHEQHLYEDMSREEFHLLSRLYSYSMQGMLMNWTKEDTENLDRIVDLCYEMIMGGISPYGKQRIGEADAQDTDRRG